MIAREEDQPTDPIPSVTARQRRPHVSEPWPPRCART